MLNTGSQLDAPQHVMHDGDDTFDDSKFAFDANPRPHPLSVAGIIFCPCMLLASCYSLHEQTEAVQLHCGKYTGLKRQPGIQCSNPCGREVRRISLKKQVIELPATKVVDGNGSPLVVSAVITFRFENTVRAALAVDNPLGFIRSQAQAVTKQVVSKYPYELSDNDQHEQCLKDEGASISREAVQLLQSKVNTAGIKVLSYSFNELSYSQEVASGMLKRQSAQAVIEARSLIVRGAVDIVEHAVKDLTKAGIAMSDREKARLLNNLLTVVVSTGGEE